MSQKFILRARLHLTPAQLKTCERMREIRLAARLSHEEFSALLGLTHGRVVNYEYGRACWPKVNLGRARAMLERIIADTRATMETALADVAQTMEGNPAK